MIEKADYIIDWSQNAIAIHNQVRAFYPSCITSFRGQQLKVKATIPLVKEYLEQLPAQLQAKWQELENLSGDSGSIVTNIKNFGTVVQTGSGLLLLTEVQLAGKKSQSGWDFVNGMRLSVGEKLGES